MSADLQPRFTVTAFLDGDDDAQLQTNNFKAALTMSLEQIKREGLCVDYTLSQPH